MSVKARRTHSVTILKDKFQDKRTPAILGLCRGGRRRNRQFLRRPSPCCDRNCSLPSRLRLSLLAAVCLDGLCSSLFRRRHCRARPLSQWVRAYRGDRCRHDLCRHHSRFRTDCLRRAAFTPLACHARASLCETSGRCRLSCRLPISCYRARPAMKRSQLRAPPLSL
jgi:hypothetical protein